MRSSKSTSMAEFLDLEAQDGVRMAWNVLPGTKQEAINCVVPVSAIYTPIKPFPNMPPPLPYAPLRCRTCRSVLNPFCIVDFAAKIWICPFCFQRNHFPPHYASITDDNLPAELFPQYTTIEYHCDSPGERSSLPPVFIFVVDTCIIEEELSFLKSSLSQAIGLLPDNSLIGLVTFGTLVHVHELGFGQIPKAYVFKGSKDISKEQLLEQMSFFLKKPKPATGVIAGARDGLSSESIARFLLPASECEFVLSSVCNCCVLAHAFVPFPSIFLLIGKKYKLICLGFGGTAKRPLAGSSRSTSHQVHQRRIECSCEFVRSLCSWFWC